MPLCLQPLLVSLIHCVFQPSRVPLGAMGFPHMPAYMQTSFAELISVVEEVADKRLFDLVALEENNTTKDPCFCSSLVTVFSSGASPLMMFLTAL